MLSGVTTLLHDDWKPISLTLFLSWLLERFCNIFKYFFFTEKENLKEQISRFDNISINLDDAAKKYWAVAVTASGLPEEEAVLVKAIRDLSSCIKEEGPFRRKKQKQKIELLLIRLNSELTDPDLFGSSVAHAPRLDIYQQSCDTLRELRLILIKRW